MGQGAPLLPVKGHDESKTAILLIPKVGWARIQVTTKNTDFEHTESAVAMVALFSVIFVFSTERYIFVPPS